MAKRKAHYHQVAALAVLLLILALGSWLYYNGVHSSSYNGLPTVPCIDDTKPVLQDYTFTLKIMIDGQAKPLPDQLGHDYAHCLHVIYTNDSSGLVYVHANDNNAYTLANLFQVWHSVFSKEQLLGHKADANHQINVSVNGQPVSTYENTLLTPGSSIEISY